MASAAGGLGWAAQGSTAVLAALEDRGNLLLARAAYGALQG